MKNKTTKRALNIQFAVRILKTNRQENLIEMGGLLRTIKTDNLFRNMTPFYANWGEYLYEEHISRPLATAAIRVSEKLDDIRSETEAAEFSDIHAHMLNMHKTCLIRLCQLPTWWIIDLMKQGVYNWSVDEINAEIHNCKGTTPREPRKNWALLKEQYKHILEAFEDAPARRGQKTLRVDLTGQLKNIISSM